MKLILVRHAMPAIAPQIRPEHWELDDSGRAGATYLARFLPARPTLVSSMEPKAYQTLVPSGPVTQDAGLNEVERDEPFDGALGLTPWRPGDDGRPPAEALGEDFRELGDDPMWRERIIPDGSPEQRSFLDSMPLSAGTRMEVCLPLTEWP